MLLNDRDKKPSEFEWEVATKISGALDSLGARNKMVEILVRIEGEKRHYVIKRVDLVKWHREQGK